MDKSYIEEYQATQADRIAFAALAGPPSAKYSHILRWYKHIKSYGFTAASFPATKKPLAECGLGSSNTAVTNNKAKDADDDDDFDLFGSDDEDDAEAERIRQERLDAYAAKKSKKPAVIAKSSILLDVKPWDDETDMAEMERLVRTIKKDGLVWGAAKLAPVAFRIKKLQIMCTVEDDKVGTDFLEEEITKFEDFVQSVDVAAFNKI